MKTGKLGPLEDVSRLALGAGVSLCALAAGIQHCAEKPQRTTRTLKSAGLRYAREYQLYEIR